MTGKFHQSLTVVQPGDLFEFASAHGLLGSTCVVPPIEFVHTVPGCLVWSVDDGVLTLPVETISTRSSFEMCIPEAVVCGDTLGVIFDQKYFLPGGFSHQHIWAVDKFGNSNLDDHIAYPDLSVVELTSKEAILVGFTSHWGHFFTDALDRLVPTENRDLPLLVDQGIPCGNAIRLLMLTGHIQGPFQLQRLAKNRLFHVAKLWMRTLSSQKPAAPAEKLLLVKESIDATIPIPLHRKRAVLVSREKVKMRKLTSDISDADMKTIGIDTVCYPEHLSIDTTISVFRSHDVIIIPIGSAKFNLIFCAPGTRVVCLTPKDYAEKNGAVCMLVRHMCAALSLKLEFYSCKTLQQSNLASQHLLHKDIFISKRELLHILSR